VQRIGEGEAVAATELAGGPAEEERLAGGLAIEDEALGFAGLREERIVSGEFGEGGERGLFAESFEDEFLRAGADAPAAGEDGLAAGGQFLTKVKRVSRSGLRGFRGCRGRGGSACRARRRAAGAGAGPRGPWRCRRAEFAGEFVEEFDEAGEDEAAEVAHAVVVELAGLERDEDDLLEDVRRAS
jgi:hypothetical protein